MATMDEQYGERKGPAAFGVCRDVRNWL